MRLASAAFVVALLAAPVAAPVASHAAQALLPAQSEIAFTSKQMGVPVQGRFERFDGTVAVDPAKPETGKVSFSVDLGSVSIGTPETATELKKPEWFDTAKAPSATFRSTSIKATSPGRVDVAGDLTIKGTTRAIVVPMTLARDGDTLRASGEFTIRRLDFKIGAGQWGDTSLVADDVLVRRKLTVRGTP